MSLPRHLAIGAALAAAISLAGPQAAANEIKSELESIERDLTEQQEKRAVLERKAREAARELKEIQRRGIALAKSVYRRSAEASRLESQLRKLETVERKKSGDMAQRRTQLSATLAALQRMARMPAATLIAIPQSPDDTIRSAIVLRAAVPKLQQEAKALAGELEELNRLRGQIERDTSSLATTLQDLDNERATLAALTADKMRLLKSTRTAKQEAAQRAAKLSAKAGSLRELLQKLAAKQRTPALRGEDFEPPPESAPEPRTAALAPVTISRDLLPAPGRVVTAFGERLANGTFSKGVSIETRPQAPVVAPVGGKIVFAGEFRGYGNLVILELPNKGHALVSGMSRISAEIGDDVLAGEPLGEMTRSGDAAPKLYFELRRRGRPINPLPPNAAHRNKVRG